MFVNGVKLMRRIQHIDTFEVDFNKISERIKQLRINSGYTQEILSEKVGYSPSYVYQIENKLRKPSVSSLTKFSLFFGVSLDYLVTGYTRPDADNLDLLLNTLSAEQRENIYVTIDSLVNSHIK